MLYMFKLLVAAKIKFKKTYLPNYAEKNLIIYGNPKKVLDIMKKNLIAYSKKDLK